MRNDQQARKAPRPRLARGAGRSLSLLSHMALFLVIMFLFLFTLYQGLDLTNRKGGV
jgi:hypothetical protein